MNYLLYNLSEISSDSIDLSVLSTDERMEADRRGGHYARVRALLRHEIAHRTGLAPASIMFSYGPHGKPHCEKQQFNLSHSGDMLCLAFHDAAIGVDIERVRPRNIQALGKRIMAPEQYTAFCDRGCQEKEFFACWCVAEALVKHAGDTMWNASKYPFLYRSGHIECLFAPAPVVHLFIPAPGYCGAIAYTPS